MLAGVAHLGLWIGAAYGNEFRVGVGAVDITPYGFEAHPASGKDPNYPWGGRYFDTGVDRKYDFEEDGAFGPDGLPGKAGVDDDGDGHIDGCDRKSCAEYLAAGSDDRRDPAGDNYDRKKSPQGTEGDARFQALHLAGFRPYYPIFLSNRFAVGVHDPIWSRAIAIQGQDGEVVVLITTDLPGLTWKHINPVRRRIAAQFGVQASRVVITSTHVHSAPDASGHWTSTMPGKNKWYTDRLKEWIFESAAIALSNLKPARMKTVTTRHFACIDPKTLVLKKEPDCRFPASKVEYKRHPELYDEWIIQRDARDPIRLNTEITALQFVSSEQDGATIATIVNWHNHPDGLSEKNMLISSDFAHYVRRYVEKHLGGMALYFTGTLGCQIGAGSGVSAPLWTEDFKRVYRDGVLDANGNPVPVLTRGGFEQSRSTGYEIGHEVVQALQRQAAFSADTKVSVRTEPVDTPVDNLLHLIGTHSVWFDRVERADRMRWYPLRCMGVFGCVRSDVSLVRVGNVGIATAPGEIDPGYFTGRTEVEVDYGKAAGKWKFPAMPSIRSAMVNSSFFDGVEHFFMLGEANNYLSYLLHGKDNHGQLNFGHPNHYEDFVTTSRHFGDDIGNKLMRMLGSKEKYSKRGVYPKVKSSGARTGNAEKVSADFSERAMRYLQAQASRRSEDGAERRWSPDGLLPSQDRKQELMTQFLSIMDKESRR